MAAFVEKPSDVWELRCRFNRGRYYERLQARELFEKIQTNPPHPSKNLPQGTKAEDSYYYDVTTGNMVAHVRQYRLPNKRLWSKDPTVDGRPDPKQLWLDGRHYSEPVGKLVWNDLSLLFP